MSLHETDNGEALVMRKKTKSKSHLTTLENKGEEKSNARGRTRKILLEHVAKGTTIIQKIQVFHQLNLFILSQSGIYLPNYFYRIEGPNGLTSSSLPPHF